MRVLIIKTSSLGDIIHTLPALSDAQKVYPNIQFDWVVEESMQNIPRWHKAVRKVIPVAQRRWRKNKMQTLLQGEFFRFLRELKQTHYDLIIDAQGLLKSAWIAYLARGKRAGFSFHSARESWASLFYQKNITVSKKGQHAVERLRALFAACLQYALPNTPPDYGISLEKLPVLQDSSLSTKPYCVFLHGTTWDTKHWPEAYWLALGKILSHRGYRIKLMWGNEQEQQRAQRIANAIETAEVLPKQSLEQAASVLAKASAIISVDTGLGHLAAALNVPTVSLYGPTDPIRTGTYGLNQIHLQVDKNVFNCAPCFSRTCLYPKTKPALGIEQIEVSATETATEAATKAVTEAVAIIEPPCFTTISPDKVMQSIEKLINNFTIDTMSTVGTK